MAFLLRCLQRAETPRLLAVERIPKLNKKSRKSRNKKINPCSPLPPRENRSELLSGGFRGISLRELIVGGKSRGSFSKWFRPKQRLSLTRRFRRDILKQIRKPVS